MLIRDLYINQYNANKYARIIIYLLKRKSITFITREI